jgi:hypothetical protein
MQITLKEAIILRSKYETMEEYVLAWRHSTHAYIWDGWMGTQQEQKPTPSPKPARPDNYDTLTQFWELVDIDRAFNGYPEDKKLHLLLEEEFYYAPYHKQREGMSF